MEVEIVNKDGKEYALIDTIEGNNNKYNFFVNSENPMDFCVLKNKIVNNKEVYSSLDDEEEFNYSLTLFYNKHKDGDFEKLLNK